MGGFSTSTVAVYALFQGRLKLKLNPLKPVIF